MSDTNVPSPEAEQRQPKRVIDHLREAPGALTNAYITGAETYDRVIREGDDFSDDVTSEEQAELLKKVFALLGYDTVDTNVDKQLDSIQIALESLIARNPLAAALDPMRSVQSAYVIGLLSGVSLINKTYAESPSFGPKSPDQE